MVALSMIVVTVKRLIALGVLSLAIWHITASFTSGVTFGKVLVYVSEQPSILSVDRQQYSITPEVSSPLVCELPPGRHVLRLKQNGKQIYEEQFTVEARREQTLFAPGRTAMRIKLGPVLTESSNKATYSVPLAQRTAFRDSRRDSLHAVSAGN